VELDFRPSLCSGKPHAVVFHWNLCTSQCHPQHSVGSWDLVTAMCLSMSRKCTHRAGRQGERDLSLLHDTLCHLPWGAPTCRICFSHSFDKERVKCPHRQSSIHRKLVGTYELLLYLEDNRWGQSPESVGELVKGREFITGPPRPNQLGINWAEET
jgi:hypothetical protein